MHNSINLNTFDAQYYELVQDDGLIIGGATTIDFMYTDAEYVQISHLNINYDFRNQGHATRLLQKIIEENLSYDLCLYCEAPAESNILEQDELREWYKRLGFVDGSPHHKGANWMHRPALDEIEAHDFLPPTIHEKH